MRKTISMLMSCLLLVPCLTGCTAGAEQHTGEAEGYGGKLKVTVAMNGNDITSVKITEHHETEGVGTRAIDALPSAIEKADSIDVDGVSGATVTSNAIKEAVSQAMSRTGVIQEVIPMDGADATQAPGISSLMGMGMASTGRVGPGKDAEGNQVYSFNVVFAHGTFDQSGKVQSLNIDQLEVATPNYDGASMPHFSGFPGQGEVSDDAFLEEVASWTTKRQRGDDYKLTTGTWEEQMDVYQQLFTGKTVDEIEAWYAKFCSDETGRPLKEETTSEADQAKYSALSDSEKSTLTDITSSATMSLRDPHGDILTAIRRAWEDARGSAP